MRIRPACNREVMRPVVVTQRHETEEAEASDLLLFRSLRRRDRENGAVFQEGARDLPASAMTHHPGVGRKHPLDGADGPTSAGDGELQTARAAGSLIHFTSARLISSLIR